MDWSTADRTESVWWATVVLMLAMFAAILVVQFFDRRLFDGASVWSKPLKFALALALHFATLALIVGALSAPWRQGNLLQSVAVASAACALFEIAYIVVQAARQEASHFNQATPLHAALYVGMAAGAVVITLAAAVVGTVVLLDGASRLGPASRLGAALGLWGGTILTLVVALTDGAAAPWRR